MELYSDSEDAREKTLKSVIDKMKVPLNQQAKNSYLNTLKSVRNVFTAYWYVILHNSTFEIAEKFADGINSELTPTTSDFSEIMKSLEKEVSSAKKAKTN